MGMPETRVISGPSFRIRIDGAFGLFRNDGSVVPVSHLKNQALLVLLAVAPGQERTRRWLEATLWSDRQAKEAGQSLRTALSALRRTLALGDSPIRASRTTIWLEPGLVEVDRNLSDAVLGDVEILEGLDIRDEAFNDWLTVFRANMHNDRRTKSGQASTDLKLELEEARTSLVIGRIASGSTRYEAFVARQVLDLIDRNLSDTINANVTELVPVAEDRQGAVILRSSVLEHAGKTRVTLRLEDPSSGKRLWHSAATTTSDLAEIERDPDILRMAFGTSSTVIEQMRRTSERLPPAQAGAEATLSRAVCEMYSFDASRLSTAEAMLKAAASDLPRPLLRAWEAMLMQIQHAETEPAARSVLSQRALAAAEEAVEEAPGNALILSIAGIVRQFLGEPPEIGFALGERAVFENPGNALGYVVLGIAFLRSGKVCESAKMIDRAEYLASHSVFLHWIEMIRCLVAISMEDYETAIRKGERASSRTQSFRSPLRHLYALHLLRGDRENARRVLARLHRVEPGFSMDLVRRDPGYPVPTIRSSPLINVSDL